MQVILTGRIFSHALGLRSIRTLFNEPYSLNTPKAMKTAGKDGIWNALDKARTQHKGKTAEELSLFANTLGQHLGEDENDVNLQKLRDEAGRDAEKERAALKLHVKGLAKTGIDIFTRRIQSQWDELCPFADGMCKVPFILSYHRVYSRLLLRLASRLCAQGWLNVRLNP